MYAFQPMGAHLSSERIYSEGFAYATYGSEEDFLVMNFLSLILVG
jgi:hypothetical protein